ncbi:MAG: hypothetical protein LCH87_07740 [Actinobacteria bacterium]|nr:hypothetical protein [Actinomycetota bacterium]MCB0910247.1 hypothetical protein [Propionibacteriaceae bacterium]
MPIHVVVAHIAVILAPISALLALAYAIWPDARGRLRWPLLVATAAALTTVISAEVSGSSLYHSLDAAAKRSATALPRPVFAHAHGSGLLSLTVVGLAALVAAFVWRLLSPGRTPDRAGRVAAGVLAVAALATIIATGLVLAQAIAAVWAQQPHVS